MTDISICYRCVLGGTIQTAVTGQVTLGGKVEKVGDVGAKAQGAVEVGGGSGWAGGAADCRLGGRRLVCLKCRGRGSEASCSWW